MMMTNALIKYLGARSPSKCLVPPGNWGRLAATLAMPHDKSKTNHVIFQSSRACHVPRQPPTTRPHRLPCPSAASDDASSSSPTPDSLSPTANTHAAFILYFI